MDLMFIAYFIFFPLIVVTFLQKFGFSILRLGVIQLVVIALFFFSFVGTLPLFFGWDEYRADMEVSDDFIMFKVMVFSGLSMLLFIIGAVFSKSFFRISSAPNDFSNIKVNTKEAWVLFCFLLIVLMVIIIYISEIPKIALFVAIADGVQEAKLARSLMGNDFQGKYHWYSLVMHELANIITFCFFSMYLLRKNVLFLLLFFSSFVLSGFSALMTTEKAPFGWLLLGLFLVYVISKKNNYYPFRKLMIFSALLLLIIAISYVYLMGSVDFLTAFSHLFSRAFAGSIQPAYYYLEFFPMHQDFLLGDSFPNPGGVFPHDHFPLAKELMNWVKPNLLERNIVGSMPTVFWVEAYANYGYFGVFIVPFFMGFMIFSIDVGLSKIANTPLKVGFYVWFVLHYMGLSVTGFSSFILDSHMFLLLLFLLFSVTLSTNMKVKVACNE